MRFAKIAAAAVALAILELAFSWRIALGGIAPDALVILATFAATGLRPVERIPVACCLGLASDFIAGSRLGPMALGYGLGAWAVEAFAPLAGSWHRSRIGLWPARAANATGMTLLAAGVAHACVALAIAVAGDTTRTGGDLALRATGIALYTAAVSPVVWGALTALVGPVGGDEWDAAPGSAAD